MSLVSDVITLIRYEINDIAKTRFETDDPILSFIKRAVVRANRIAERNMLQFAKKKATLTTVANQNYVSLPTDFDVDIGLWRDSSHSKIKKTTEGQWEQIISASTIANWYLDIGNSQILFNGAPSSVETLTLYYFPKIDTSTYVTTTTMPWGGRLDDIIVEYVSLRLKNTEEMDVSIDLQLMTDMENQILQAYALTSVTNSDGAGWIINA